MCWSLLNFSNNYGPSFFYSFTSFPAKYKQLPHVPHNLQFTRGACQYMYSIVVHSVNRLLVISGLVCEPELFPLLNTEEALKKWAQRLNMWTIRDITILVNGTNHFLSYVMANVCVELRAGHMHPCTSIVYIVHYFQRSCRLQSATNIMKCVIEFA